MYTNYYANNTYRTNGNSIRTRPYTEKDRIVYPVVSVLSDDAWNSWCKHTASAYVILDTSVLMPFRQENLSILYERVLWPLAHRYNTTFYVTEDVKADLSTLANSYDASRTESIELARESLRWLMTYINRGVVKVAENSAMHNVDVSIRQLAMGLMNRNCKVAVLTRDRAMATDLLKAGVWTWYMDTKLKLVQFTNLTVPGIPQRQGQRKGDVVPFEPKGKAARKKGFIQWLMALFGKRAA